MNNSKAENKEYGVLALKCKSIQNIFVSCYGGTVLYRNFPSDNV